MQEKSVKQFIKFWKDADNLFNKLYKWKIFTKKINETEFKITNITVKYFCNNNNS